MKQLHVSEDLLLPATDTTTQTIVVYGAKGMGKTNFGTVLVEELSSAGQRFSVLDPVGVWHGLRHGSDGKSPGVPCLLLGGKYGDLPLEPTGGIVIADLVADEDIDTVIDISRRADGRMWSNGEKIRFVTDYATRLYERQGERRRPLMQVFDEAGRFVPQNPPKGAFEIAKCIGAIEQLTELGRNVGVGVCLITQRSARMNKSVSELAECMVAFRTVGPRSVDAILDWFGEHVPKERWKVLVEELRKLPRGTALVVSPGWLDFEGVARMRPRRTFDSSATPVGGKEKKVSGPGARPNLDQYLARMSQSIERAKAEDPKELRRRIAELERELKAEREKKAAPERIEIPILSEADKASLRSFTELVDGQVRILAGCAERIAQQIAAATAVKRDRVAPIGVSESRGSSAKAPAARAHGTGGGISSNGHADIGAGERKILVALAQHPNGLTREQLGIITGYRRSTRNTYLQRLQAAHCIAFVNGDRALIKDSALKDLGDVGAPTHGVELQQFWLDKLGQGGERKILELLIEIYPKSIERETLSEQLGYARSSRNTYLQRLAAGHLVTSVGTSVRASDELF